MDRLTSKKCRYTLTMIVAMVFAFLQNTTYAQDCSNAVVLTTQAELEEFAQVGCDSIQGNLQIIGPGVTDVTPLNFIKYIGGNLGFINASGLERIEGFNNLTDVEDGILIPTGGNTLTTIDGFESLTNIGGFGINVINETNLQTVRGFNSLINGSVISFQACPLTTVEAFQNVETLETLSIIDSEVEDVSFMSNLSIVGSQVLLAANKNLNTLEGLSKLGFIEFELIISANDALTSLEGLNSLNGVTTIQMQDNASLNTIEALENLEFLEEIILLDNPVLDMCCVVAPFLNSSTLESVNIANNGSNCNDEDSIFEACTITCSGDITLSSQADVNNWEGCTIVEGQLRIEGADIVDLTPLSGLQTASELVIIGNPLLTNLSGLENFGLDVEQIVIDNNAQLTDISAFRNVETVGSLVISRNGALTAVNGFQNLVFSGGISIIANNILASLEGFQSLSVMNGRFELLGNAAIQSLIGLESLTSVNAGIIIDACPNISDISALSNLRNVSQLFALSNTALTNLDGLENLRTISGDLNISNNDLLLNLNGISNLTTVSNSLTITNNANLTDCCGVSNLLFSGGVSGDVDFSNNPAPCSSQNNIFESCDISICNGNNPVILRTQAEVEAFAQVGCDSLQGGLRIMGPDITDLTPLNFIQYIGGTMAIISVSNLERIEGFNNLTDIEGGIQIPFSGNTLTTIDGFENLTNLGESGITVIDQTNLQTVRGFNSLPNIGTLWFQGTPLTTMEAFQNVENVEILSIIETELVDLSFLSNLSVVGDNVLIGANDNLISLEGLNNLEIIDFSFTVFDNNALTSLEGLNNLRDVNTIRIDGNEVLNNIEALAGIELIEEIEINNNRDLNTCCVITPFLNSGTLEEVAISNNGEDCNSAAAIFDACIIDEEDDMDVAGVDLKLSIEANHDQYEPFKDIVYTLTLENRGTELAQDIVVDVPEASKQFGSGDFAYTYHILGPLAAQRGSFNTTFTDWTISELAPGESVQMELILYVLAQDRPVTVFTQVSTSFPQDADATPGNDTNGIVDEDDEAAVTVTPNTNATVFTDIALQVSADKRNVSDNEAVTYNILVSNTSNQDATNVRVQPVVLLSNINTVDFATSLGDFDAETGVWILSNLPANSSASLTLNTIVSEVAPYLQYSWQLTAVDQNERDSSPNNGFGNNLNHEDDEDSFIIFPSNEVPFELPDLSLELEVDNPVLTPNSFATFTLTLSNTGGGIANAVFVDWPLPAGLAHAELVVSRGTYSSWSGIWFLGDPLMPDETAEIVFTVYTKSDASDVTSFAQVLSMEEEDADSTPGNRACCEAIEDDEAAVTLSTVGLRNESSASTSQIKHATEIEVYPNPVSEILNINFTSNSTQTDLRIIDLTGRTVMQQSISHYAGNTSIKLIVDSLPAGMYYLKLNNDSIQPAIPISIMGH